ncbi:hypothetical protein BGP_5579 [Beggiatoa sp. PS]|nr:hypothetical protein BGP_5579 [Beggiatoa sp. PS]
MPQMGQLPGSGRTIWGCIGQTYLTSKCFRACSSGVSFFAFDRLSLGSGFPQPVNSNTLIKKKIMKKNTKKCQGDIVLIMVKFRS